MPPGKIDEPPKEVVRQRMPTPGSEAPVEFLLMDRTGPIAEFKSWEDARRYMTNLQISGASIVRIKKNPLESEEATE